MHVRRLLKPWHNIQAHDQISRVSGAIPGLPQLLEPRDRPHGLRMISCSALLRPFQDTPRSPGGRSMVLQRSRWLPPALGRRSRGVPGPRAGAVTLRDSAPARRWNALHHRAGPRARQGIRFS